MYFCSNCDNMYYLKINDKNTNKLLYYCRQCGNEDDSLVNNEICVLKTKLKDNEQVYHHIINEYTKEDPTIPRITNIKCPNTDCPSNINSDDENKDESVKREVLYIRYDDLNMKYVYLCAICDKVWES